MPHLAAREKWLLGIIIVGFAICSAPDAITTSNPALFGIYSSPALAVGVTVAAAITLVALVAFARVGHTPQRGALVAAMLVAGGYSGIIQTIALLMGWWTGKAFSGLLLAEDFAGMRGAPSFAEHLWLVVGIYALIRARNLLVARVVYAGFLLLLVVGTIYSDQMYFAEGVFAFAHGYSIAWDVLYALPLFLLPVAAYEIRLRRA